MRTLGTTLALFIFLVLASCKGGVSEEEKAALAALEGLPRIDYAQGPVSFSLAEIEGLKRVSKDSVPWAMYMNETDSNGQMGYYFQPGYRLELSAPQIRLEYMHRELKGCSSADSIFSWIKGIYLTPERNGKVLAENEVGTLDGQMVKILEIATPDHKMNDTMSYSGKHMAWAYTENGDHLIGFAYSAVTDDEYNQGIAQFRDLVRSYKDAADNPK